MDTENPARNSSAPKNSTLATVQPYLRQELYTRSLKTILGLVEFPFPGDVRPHPPDQSAEGFTIPEIYCLHNSTSKERKLAPNLEMYCHDGSIERSLAASLNTFGTGMQEEFNLEPYSPVHLCYGAAQTAIAYYIRLADLTLGDQMVAAELKSNPEDYRHATDQLTDSAYTIFSSQDELSFNIDITFSFRDVRVFVFGRFGTVGLVKFDFGEEPKRPRPQATPVIIGLTFHRGRSRRIIIIVGDKGKFLERLFLSDTRERMSAGARVAIGSAT